MSTASRHAGSWTGFARRSILRAERSVPQRSVVHDRTVIGLFADLAEGLVRGSGTGRPGAVDPPLRAGAAGLRPDRRGPGGVCPTGPVQAPRDGELTPLDPSQRAVVEAVARGRDVRVEAPAVRAPPRSPRRWWSTPRAPDARCSSWRPRRGPLDDLATRLGEHGLARLLPVVTAAEVTSPTTSPARRPAEPVVPASTAADVAARRALLDVRPRWGASRLDVLRALAGYRTGRRRLVDGGGRDLTSGHAAGAGRPRRPQRGDPVARPRPRTSRRTRRSPRRAPGWARRSAPSRRRRALSRPSTGCARPALDEARGLMDDLAHGVGLRSGGRVSDWGDQLDLFVAVRATLDVFLPAVYERPLDEVIAATASSQWRDRHDIDMTGRERRRWKRQAAELVRPGMKPDDLHEALRAADTERRQWDRVSGQRAQPHVPLGLGIADAAYRRVTADLSFLEHVLDGDVGCLGPEGPDAGVARGAARGVARGPRRPGPAAPAHDHAGRSRQAGPDGAGRLSCALRERAGTSRRDVSRWLGIAGFWLPWRSRTVASRRRVSSDVRPRPVQAGAGPRVTARATTALALPFLGEMTTRVDTVLLLEGQRLGLAEAVAGVARGRQVIVVGDPHGLRPTTVEDADGVDSETERLAPQRTSVLDATLGRLMTLCARPSAPQSCSRWWPSGRPCWRGRRASRAGRCRHRRPQPVTLEIVEDGIVPVTASPDEASPPQEVERVVALVLDAGATQGAAVAGCADTRTRARAGRRRRRAPVPRSGARADEVVHARHRRTVRRGRPGARGGHRARPRPPVPRHRTNTPRSGGAPLRTAGRRRR